MRKLPWAVISLVAAGAAVNLAFTGCGSEEFGSDLIANDDGGDGTASSSGTTSGSGGTSSSGGSSGTSSSSGGSSSGDAGGDAAQDGDIVDGQTCALVGQNCTAATAASCCSKTCLVPAGQTAGECGVAQTDGGSCTGAGGACTSPTECCTGSCIGSKCSATACKTDTPAESCTSNAECCSGKCDVGGTGKCVALGGATSCRIEGNACTQNADCCSKQCGASGKCVNVSFCTQTGDVCAKDFECCGGDCVKQGSDTLGRCSTISGSACNPGGTICMTLGCDNTCCSLSCGPYGNTGVNICQPPSGCKPQNELCSTAEDCCGGPGRPTGRVNGDTQGTQNPPKTCDVAAGDSFGRCAFLQCLRPGDVCKAISGVCGGTSNNCCEGIFPDGGLPGPNYCNSGSEECCSRDALGIPRCRAVNFRCVEGQTVPAGQLCATSADCCGKPCVDNKCQSSCVPKNGACTVTADCCSGVECVFPTGSTDGICGGTLLEDGGVTTTEDASTDAGTDSSTTQDATTCSLYGQTCTVSSNCCDGVPCVGGTCRFN